MERRKFEESFKEAFKDAGVQPSERVWTNIELDLIKAEGEKMKRRIFFYQMLAAASISFAVIFAGVGFYALKENREQQIALSQYNDNAIEKESKTPLTPLRKADELASRQNNSDAITSTGEDVSRPETTENGTDHQSPSTTRNPGKSIPQDLKSLDQDRIAKGLNGNNQSGEISSNDSGEITPLTDPSQSNESSFGITSKEDLPTKNNASSGRNDDEIFSRSASENLLAENEDQVKDETLTSGQPLAVTEERETVKRNLPALFEASDPSLVFTEEKSVEADPVALMFARLNDLEKELAKAGSEKGKSASKERLWTSVGFAAGAFNSITSGQAAPQSNPSLSMTNNSAAQNQTRASGVAYSMGISMGTQVSDRWVVQGGVNYLTEMSDYTSTQAVQQSGTFKAASVNQFRNTATLDATERFIPTAPYTVNNSNEYLSIPLQAGYLIIKRKVQWQLNAGVSTDLFLQNTVDPEGNIAKTTSDAGDDSPFRTVNFSGLIGSEVSYRFGEHYRLGLNPGLRYALNSIYKDNLGLESSPLTFDIGLRFRYIFR